MTINDIKELCVEPSLQIIEVFLWVGDNYKTVYKGNMEEVPDEYADTEIRSIDCSYDNVIGYNIEA